MGDLAGVRLEPWGPVHYYAAEPALGVGDAVVVDMPEGERLGRVVIAPAQVVLAELPAEPNVPIRQATREDVARLRRSPRAAAVLAWVRERVQQAALPLEPLVAEDETDEARLVVYYRAAGPLDLRELADALAATFRTRIELRDLGAGAALGGLGRVLGLPPASPTDEGLAGGVTPSLSPGALGQPPDTGEDLGLCARLLHALSPTNARYLEAKARLPRLGTTVATAQGPARVIAVAVLTERVTTALADGTLITLAGPDLTPVADDESREAPRRGGKRRGRRERPVNARPASEE